MVDEDAGAGDDHGAGIPARLRRLWRLPIETKLGRPAELDVDRVVRAAIALADLGGLSDVTLPKIAKSLAVTPMALYRHVGSKAELLELVADAAFGPPPRIAAPPGDWRAGLREWADAQRQSYRARPWLAQLPIIGPPQGPNQIAWMESALQVLHRTELGTEAKLGVLTLISGYVRTTTQLERDWNEAASDPEQTYPHDLIRLVTPGRFPELARILTSGGFSDAPPQASPGASASDWAYSFGMDRILDGIAAVADPESHRR